MSQVLQPLGSHHLLLVVPRYTFRKLFLLHLRPAISLRVHNLFQPSTGTCAARAGLAHVRSCMCGCVSEEGELGEATLLFRSFKNAHYSTPSQTTGACACTSVRLPTMVLAAVQGRAENPPAVKPEELHAIAPSLALPR